MLRMLYENSKRTLAGKFKHNTSIAVAIKTFGPRHLNVVELCRGTRTVPYRTNPTVRGRFFQKTQTFLKIF